MDVIEIIASILGLAIGIIVGYFIRKNISETKIGEAKALANDIIDKANKDSETIKKEMTLDCPFCNPLQSRVISGAPCYLTSCGYLSFY